MRYRFATLEDAEQLAEMNWHLLREEGHRNPMPVPELRDRMARWLAGDYRAVLFEDNDGIAGYALYLREPEWIYLRQLWVHPERRRQGIARAAFEWMDEHAWVGADRVRLEVLVGHAPAIHFWRAVGFTDYCVTMEREIHP